MKKKLILLILLFLFLFSSFPILGQELSNNEKYKQNQTEIEEVERKLAELSSQAQSLSKQIGIMDNQIKLTLLKINQTQQEIEALSAKIGRLEVSLDYLSQLLSKRIAATYKKGSPDSLTLFLSSKKFADFINESKYLQVVQAHDRKLLFAMEETRQNYDEQKTEVEALQEKLELQKALLDRQKRDKEYLLGVTKKDEKKYSELLAQLRKEQEAILAILAGKGDLAEVGPINKGDAIATIINGASACSRGTHLHFEVVQNGSTVNPITFLKPASLIIEPEVQGINPSGAWDWPLGEPIRITQEYGETFWTRMGGLWYKFHTGIDMVSGSYDNPGSRTVRSVESGNLFRGSVKCGGGDLRYVRVDQKDGIQTYYLHIN